VLKAGSTVSVIRVWVDPPPDLPGLIRAIRFGTGLLPDAFRAAVLAGEPVYEAELFRSNFGSVADELRQLVGVLGATGATFIIREGEDPINPAVLGNILDEGLERFQPE
jgi:hypothetical protein